MKKNKSECEFKPFRFDKRVCQLCGELVDVHSDVETEATQFQRDMWMVLLEQGHVPSYYGGSDDVKTLELRAHFHIPLGTRMEGWNAWVHQEYEVMKPAKACEPDWKKIREIDMQSIAEFKDSFTDSSYYRSAIGGHIICVCRRYQGFLEQVVLENKTLGQLIWLVTKKAEENDR